MTLIACTHLNTYPTILGDLLISSPEKREPFDLPVRPGHDFAENLSGEFGLWPNSFWQKIYIFSPTIVLAFAGYVSEMKNFYLDFKLFASFHSGKLTEENIEQFLNTYHRPSFSRSSCIILNVTEYPDQTLQTRYYFVGSWDSGHTESLQDMFVVGSGSTDFLRQVTSRTLQLDDFNPTDPKNAFIQTAMLATELLGWDLLGDLTIRNLWGGAYEIASFYEGKFQKMDNMAFVISLAEYSPASNEIPTPKVVIHVKYYGNILLVTSIPVADPQITHTETSVIISCKKHFLKYYPIIGFNNISVSEFDSSAIEKSFSTRNVGISYILTRENLLSVNPVTFEFEGAVLVEFEYRNELRIIIPRERLEMMKAYNIKRDSQLVGNEIE